MATVSGFEKVVSLSRLIAALIVRSLLLMSSPHDDGLLGRLGQIRAYVFVGSGCWSHLAPAEPSL